MVCAASTIKVGMTWIGSDICSEYSCHLVGGEASIKFKEIQCDRSCDKVSLVDCSCLFKYFTADNSHVTCPIKIAFCILIPKDLTNRHKFQISAGYKVAT